MVVRRDAGRILAGKEAPLAGPAPGTLRSGEPLPSAPPGDGLVTVGAIDRLVRARGERHLCGLAALRADRIEHGTLDAAAAPVTFARAPALGAPGRLVLESLLRIELLFASRKRELRATVTAGEVPVLKSHVSPQFHLSEMIKPGTNTNLAPQLT